MRLVLLPDNMTGNTAQVHERDSVWNPQELATKVTAGTAQNMTVQTRAWDGCVEERTTGSTSIDGPANSAATRWKPALKDLAYFRTNATTGVQTTQAQAGFGGSLYSCVMPARRLATMTQAQVDAYLADPRFVAHGYTYHDSGMIWGTRMMSTGSVFAADHGAAPNGREVTRHIIFMTDGDMRPDPEAYGPHGIEALDRRLMGATAPTEANLRTLHNQRFTAACQAARTTHNISVWVVAFGQALTPELTACANPGQARQANNAAQLQTMLQEIAQKIAELRLSK
jgi:hypothetical protein